MKNLIICSLLALTFLGCALHRKTTEFEKVKFHTTMCFGTCPVYHLEVGNDKSMKLFAEFVFKKGQGRSGTGDSTKMGYFTGTVSDTSFVKLVKALNTAIKDTVWKEANCCDAPVKTVIIYYNGKRKYLKSMFPPENARELTDVLYEICQTEGLTRTDQKFEIEQ